MENLNDYFSTIWFDKYPRASKNFFDWVELQYQKAAHISQGEFKIVKEDLLIKRIEFYKRDFINCNKGTQFEVISQYFKSFNKKSIYFFDEEKNKRLALDFYFAAVEGFLLNHVKTIA